MTHLNSGRVFLESTVAVTRDRVARLRAETSFDALKSEGERHSQRPFASALRMSQPAIVAEIKKASPSKGMFRADFDHAALATAYEAGGAAAISIVTEPAFFLGRDEWITEAREITTIPILRKDFILDPIQVAESSMLGADALLLIGRILSQTQLRELADAAERVGLEILYEAHDEDDLEKVVGCGPRIVGVNSRNLDTFAVDTGQFARLRSQLPMGAIAVAESGIDSPAQIAELQQLGYHAFLIGETLVQSADPAGSIRCLRSRCAT